MSTTPPRLSVHHVLVQVSTIQRTHVLEMLEGDDDVIASTEDASSLLADLLEGDPSYITGVVEGIAIGLRAARGRTS